MKNETFYKAFLTIGLTLLISTSSFAQSKSRNERKKPPTFEELIEAMDSNDDGKLSKEEVRGRLKNDFEKFDANEDGFITSKEFEDAPRPERPSQRN